MSVANSMDAATSVSEASTRVSGKRFVAHVVDYILFTIAAIVVLIPFGVLAAMVDSGAAQALYVLALFVVFTVGHVWFLVRLHGKNGQSPGKKLVGIKVVDANGGAPSNGAMWKRSVTFIVEYFYIIAWIGMMVSSHRQRLGDRLGDTYVVEA